jgi:hypothetical protein
MGGLAHPSGLRGVLLQMIGKKCLKTKLTLYLVPVTLIYPQSLVDKITLMTFCSFVFYRWFFDGKFYARFYTSLYT